MNERIKELAKNCYETSPLGKDGWPQSMKFNEEKFAELIIKECVSICDEVQDKYGQYTFTARVVKERIKEHFGVE